METAPSSPVRKTFAIASLASVVTLGMPFVCCIGSCGANFYYMASAPPIRSAVAAIEASPVVRERLGDGVDVSLVVTRDLERDFFKRGGRDRVFLITNVEGSQGEALLRLDAVNVDGQGWAGGFSLEQQGRQVLRNGSYEIEGGGAIFTGTFAPDGSVGSAP